MHHTKTLGRVRLRPDTRQNMNFHLVMLPKYSFTVPGNSYKPPRAFVTCFYAARKRELIEVAYAGSGKSNLKHGQNTNFHLVMLLKYSFTVPGNPYKPAMAFSLVFMQPEKEKLVEVRGGGNQRVIPRMAG